MASEKKVWDISKDPVALQPSEGNTIQVFIILFIIPFSVALCAIGCLYTSYHARNLNNTSGFSQPPVVNASQNISIKVRIIPKQPHCTSEEHITEVLTELIDQLKKANLRKFVCKPEDFIAEQSQEISLDVNSDSAPTQNILTEPRTHFVIYIAVGLLLVSLLTAFVDVYKVKGKPCKIKPQLTKRCSLADLTVLRHSRRESMKKDFITEEQRGPQKLQGQHSTLVYRRSSCPVYTIDVTADNSRALPPNYPKSRRVSFEPQDEMYSYDSPHNHVVRIIRRF